MPTNTLGPGEALQKGKWLTSSLNGKYRAGLDNDGRFVVQYVFSGGVVLVWSNNLPTMDGSRGVPHLAMHPNGYLSVWDGHSVEKWWRPENSWQSQSQLVIENDGGISIRRINDVGVVTWRPGSRTFPVTGE